MQNKWFYLVATGLLVIMGLSCNKSKEPNAAFSGIYIGSYNTTPSGPSAADTLVIAAGATANSVIVVDQFLGITFTGNVSNDTFYIPSQTVSATGYPSYLPNGYAYTVSGFGVVTKDTVNLYHSNFFYSWFAGVKQ